MIKKPFIIGCCLIFWSIVFLLVGVLTPIILGDLLEQKIKDGVTLTDSNGVDTWGQIPGKFEAIMYQQYHFFNILNPNEVMEGEAPYIEEKTGYVYQEFDNFTNIDYRTAYEGNDIIRFNLLRYYQVTDNTVWPDDITPNDPITTISLGALGAWYQLKHASRQQLALSTLYSIASGLETSLALAAYAQGTSGFLGNFNVAYLIIFSPAGISPALAAQIWYDADYGMGNWVSLQVWVIALQENLNPAGQFSLPVVLNGTIQILSQYFGLSKNQLNSIFTGQLYNAYSFTTLIFYSQFDCAGYNISEYVCDPVYLAALQWSQSNITLYPPAGASASTISVSSTNSSSPGYPEIYYYFQSNNLSIKYNSCDFGVDDYMKIFAYNRSNGFPIYNPNSLLDVGRINSFFNLSSAYDFQGVMSAFNLTSVTHARVLWDYVNALIDFTALQGKYDPGVYNIENRGVSTEASMGSVGSETLYSLIVGMSETIPLVVTSVYDYLRAKSDNNTCVGLVSQIIGSNNSIICTMPKLEWSTTSEGLSLWILAYWSEANSSDWKGFQQVSGLNNTSMDALFNKSNALSAMFAGYDLELKNAYNCTNPGPRCDPMYLAKMQWGQGYVTENLPIIFADLNIGNSSSITNYPFMSMGLEGTPEYYAYASRRAQSKLTVPQINFLLSFDQLYGSTHFQSFFIHMYTGNYTGASVEFGLSLVEVETMANYLRYIIDKYFLGGLIQTKTVNQILWDDYEPLVAAQLVTSPLLGGDPAASMSQTSVGQNMTQDKFDNCANSSSNNNIIPCSFKDGMDSGQTHIDDIRTYRLYGGVPYLNFPTRTYLGEGPDQPIIEYVNYNPWAIQVPVAGTDGWQFQPYIEDSDQITFFLDSAGIIFQGAYKETLTVRDFDCLRYGISSEILQNVTENPYNAAFYAYAPTGLVNETSVFGAPLFGSKPYFLDGDPMLNNLVNYSDPSLVVSGSYDSVFDIEKYTGTVFHALEQLQYNFELVPDNLYPRLGLNNLRKYGYRTYLPFFYLQRSETLIQHIVDKYFDNIHTILLVIYICVIVGYTLGGILFIAFVGYVYYRYRKHKALSIVITETGHSLIPETSSPRSRGNRSRIK